MTTAGGSSAVLADARTSDREATSDASLNRVFDLTVTRERILAAAITTVAERGFGGLTVKEVAHLAGIKAPGLYSHFPSREAILTEAVSRVLNDFMETMASVVDGDAETELRDTVRLHVLYQIENMLIARVADLVLNTATAGHFLSSEDDELLLAVQRKHLALVRARVAAFAPSLGPDKTLVAATAIVAMCDRVANWYQIDGPLSPTQLADLHWDLARSMLT